MPLHPVSASIASSTNMLPSQYHRLFICIKLICAKSNCPGNFVTQKRREYPQRACVGTLRPFKG
jgi:uncharacterized protein YcgI (DUF1989 family)